MPENSPFQRKLVLNKETVRSLTGLRGAGFITTQGRPSQVYTYCTECEGETEETRYCTMDCTE